MTGPEAYFSDANQCHQGWEHQDETQQSWQSDKYDRQDQRGERGYNDQGNYPRYEKRQTNQGYQQRDKDFSNNNTQYQQNHQVYDRQSQNRNYVNEDDYSKDYNNESQRQQQNDYPENDFTKQELLKLSDQYFEHHPKGKTAEKDLNDLYPAIVDLYRKKNLVPPPYEFVTSTAKLNDKDFESQFDKNSFTYLLMTLSGY